MKYYYFLLILPFFLCSCHENIEKRAEREAREYTLRYCPTPVVNFTRTDSVAFFRDSRCYVYYCSFVGNFDNAQVVNAAKAEIHQGLHNALVTNADTKPYADAGIAFVYIVRSGSRPDVVLLNDTIKIQQQ